MKFLFTDRFGVTFTVQTRRRPWRRNTGKPADAIALNMTVNLTHNIPPDGNRHALSIDSARKDGHTYRIFTQYLPGDAWPDIENALSYGVPFNGATGGILYNQLFNGGFIEAVRRF